MANYLKAGDVINGKEGSVYANINGKLVNMLDIKKLDAKVEKQKSDIPVLGFRGMQTKAKGFKGSGSATAYYISSEFRRMMLEYMNTGIDTYFTIIVTNADPNTDLGSQQIQLNNVNLDSISIAKIDIDADNLDEEFNFTFDNAIPLKLFDRPSYFD
ncbi:MAG: phage tail tube protein [Anaerovoracaceae bacterium]